MGLKRHFRRGLIVTLMMGACYLLPQLAWRIRLSSMPYNIGCTRPVTAGWLGDWPCTVLLPVSCGSFGDPHCR
ncbi:hypothetical protein BA1DRAFT_02494 [Photorhabdus aegyptia]|uniref:Uncharacterized protein n=1 Tax=Photorhabdus aegyptia TaxID=2805098 RepID=A0A022PH82_9GAMM|nr:hypothetical protein BA1DRAFT_02494 [Photorhabdus aegyptia]